METKKDIHFSVFQNKCSKKSAVRTLEQVMNAIIGGIWKKELDEIRLLLEQGKTEEASARKGKLIYVTYSGVFEGGHKATQLKEYSQLIVGDFDNVERNRLEESLLLLKELPWVASAFVTPSWGLKATALVDSDVSRHKKAFGQVMRLMEEKLNLKSDVSCSDVCRGHFVSYSPTGWYNPDVVPLHIEEEETTPKHATKTAKGKTGKGGIPPLNKQKADKEKVKPEIKKGINKSKAQCLMLEAMKALNDRMKYTQHNRNTYVYNLMCMMNRKGVDRAIATMLAYDIFDLQEAEIDIIMTNAYSHIDEFGCEWEREMTLIEKIEEYLDKHFVLRKNIVLGQVEFLRKGEDEQQWCPMTDYEENSVFRNLLMNGFGLNASLLRNILNSDYVPKFDPFKAYIEQLPPWDGVTDHIGRLTAKVKTANQEVFESGFRKWLVATVAGWLVPEICNETVLAFTGAQATHKTTFLTRLIPPALKRYSDNISRIPSAEDKDARMSLAQCGLINIDEVEALSRQAQAQFKSMLTVKQINERPAYAHHKEVMPRRASFTSSTNFENVLNDPTGSRRWSYHKILSIESPYQYEFPYEGMYAQAYAMFKSGFRYWYEGDELNKLNLYNENFKAATVEEEQLAVCFRLPQEDETYELMTSTQIMQRMMQLIHVPMSLVKIGLALQKRKYEFSWKNGVKVYKVKQLDATDIEINKHSI